MHIFVVRRGLQRLEKLKGLPLGSDVGCAVGCRVGCTVGWRDGFLLYYILNIMYCEHIHIYILLFIIYNVYKHL